MPFALGEKIATRSISLHTLNFFVILLPLVTVDIRTAFSLMKLLDQNSVVYVISNCHEFQAPLQAPLILYMMSHPEASLPDDDQP
jgi:hypothetical protein